MNEYIVRETDCCLATKQEIVGELVRCKDCRHYCTNNTAGFPNCEILKRFVTGDWFCAYGERKDTTDDNI